MIKNQISEDKTMSYQIENFIDMLEINGMNTVMFSCWYSDFIFFVNKCKKYYESGKDIFGFYEYKQKNILFENLYGFVWGVYAVGFLNTQQCNRLLHELCYINKIIPHVEPEE